MNNMTAASMETEGLCIGEQNKYQEVDFLASSYASYLHVDGFMQTQQFDDSIEELLTKLDEYHGLLDMIRSDTTLCLQKNLPLIQARAKDMEKIFDKIDKLEVFVAVVKKNMSVIEEKVSKAETELATLHGFRKVLSTFPVPSFFAPKSPPRKRLPRYEAPGIFRTKDYIITSGNAKNKCSQLNTKGTLSVDSFQYDSQIEQSGSTLTTVSVRSSVEENIENRSEASPSRLTDAAPPRQEQAKSISQTEGVSPDQQNTISVNQSEANLSSQSEALCPTQLEDACSSQSKAAPSSEIEVGFTSDSKLDSASVSEPSER